MSQFGFLHPEWPDIHDAATRAEALAVSDPRPAPSTPGARSNSSSTWLYTFDSA